MTAAPTLEGRAAAYRPLIEAEMRAVVGTGPDRLSAWMRYHLGWQDEAGRPIEAAGGKLMRAVAVVLACEALDGRVERAVPAAAAVELVHNFSLLHDDVEDRSDRRRGRPTLWALAGAAHAINTGDGMFALARRAMHRLPEVGVPASAAVEAMRELDDACVRLVEGQYLDMTFEERSEVSMSEYLEMTAGKTAAMFAAPFAIGATLAGAPPATVEAFRSYGHHIGLAFQGVDDVLGIWGDPAVTGKPVGDDLRSRKRTYPVIAAIEAGGDEASKLADRYATPARPNEDVTDLTRLIERLDGRAATERFVEAERAAALEALAPAHLDAATTSIFESFALAAAARTS
ncbi:MAG: polyprenyl synthetase family protein [Dehalococcoidia bacterium]